MLGLDGHEFAEGVRPARLELLEPDLDLLLVVVMYDRAGS